jgi:hypothetical protein
MLYFTERYQLNIVSFCAKHLHVTLKKINLGCEKMGCLGKYIDLRHRKKNKVTKKL